MRIIPGRAAGCADFYHHRTIKPQAYTAGGFFHICRRRLQRGFAMEVGALRRFNHIINPQTGRAIIVPMDHGVSDGVPRGLRDMAQAVQDMDEGMADAVLLHKGLIHKAKYESHMRLGFIMHISASTSLSRRPNKKMLVGDVEEAVRLGADAVSIHINLGDDDESMMMSDAGKVAKECSLWGMPLLMMVYARGHDVDSFDPHNIAHCARVGAELGADIVKVPYTGDPETFADVVADCGVPVLIAGGPKLDSTRKLLEMVHGSLQAGGSGLSVGRNVFEHPHRVTLLHALRAMVHQGASVEEALDIMGEK